MIEIKSKKERGKTLHIINKLEDFEGRIDLIPRNEFLQCCVVKKNKGIKFDTHKHIFKETNYTKHIAQEAWLVFRGRIKCYYYDLDDTPLGTEILSSGDVSITLYGGHTFEILDDDTIIYEFKIGPYEGKNKDKELINE